MSRLLRTGFTGIAKDKIGPLVLNCIARLTNNPFYTDIAPYTNDINTALTAYTPAAAIKNPVPAQTAALAQLRDAFNQALGSVARYANSLPPRQRGRPAQHRPRPHQRPREAHQPGAPPKVRARRRHRGRHPVRQGNPRPGRGSHRNPLHRRPRPALAPVAERDHYPP